MKNLSLFILPVMVFALSCSSESSQIQTKKQTNVEIISGRTRDDLLDIFIKDICHPVDSAFLECYEIAISSDNSGSYNSDIFLLRNTLDLITYKADKLEKFKVYEIDRNNHNKMLKYLSNYNDIINNYCIQLVQNKYSSSTIKEEKKKEIQETINIMLAEQEKLYLDIVKDYNFYHNET